MSDSSISNAVSSQNGQGQKSSGISIKTFVASLSVAIIIFAVEFAVFLVFKTYGSLKRIYQPRTYLVPERERTHPPPAGIWAWIRPVFKTSNSEFIQKCGLDAYFFLRYLRMLLKIFAPLSLLILPILLPINKIGGKDNTRMSGGNSTTWNVTGLDQLAWGNVAPDKTSRYWAHLVLAVFVVIYVCAIFFDELRGYIRLRQAYLTSPQHRIRASATTVLVTAIPRKWCTVEALDGLYDVFPGGIRNIWINRNFDDLMEKVKERDSLAMALESAETNLIRLCKKYHMDAAKEKAPTADAPGNGPHTDPETAAADESVSPSDVEESGGKDSEPLWKKYAKEGDREKMRLPIFGWKWMVTLPLLGKKVDTIDHCRKEVARLNAEIEEDQAHPDKFPLMNSAFVQFNHQVAAHMACQSVSHHLPKQMAPRMVEIDPDDIIWENMSIKWWERYLRTTAVIVIICFMVIGWAFPVAFTGLLSQLSYLEERFSWLQWINKVPTWLLSLVQGVLPATVLSILMAVLPLILRFLVKKQGVHTGMAMEMGVQRYYFAFNFVQIFLIVSISASVTTVLRQLTQVQNIPSLLAQNIPKASNYFFSYMILQAMSVSAGALVQIFTLVSWFILAPILDNTARKKWGRTTNLNQMQWGTFFPVYTTLACIGLIYSVISPLIMIFNCITFSLFWFVYRYNTLYVTKFRFDTGGLLFPKAINQLFTGLYVMEICLIGLFFLVRDDQGQVACEGQAVCMIVVTALTVLYQILLNEAFSPLYRYIPITLEDDAVERDEAFARSLGKRHGLVEDEEEGDSVQNVLEERERREREEERREEDIEMRNIEADKQQRKDRRHALGNIVPERLGNLVPGNIGKLVANRTSWADRSRNRRSNYFGGHSSNSVPTVSGFQPHQVDSEAQAEAKGPTSKSSALGQALFGGIHDELEDLTPNERDRLVQRAFLHEALRSKRPIIWIPRDDLGVSDDEIRHTRTLSKDIWISNEYQGLDGKARAVFSRSPPDFSEVDLIQL